MPFRRRSSCKPYSSRGCDNIRQTSKHDEAEIESWVDFVLKNDSDNEEQYSLPSLKGKKYQQNQFMIHEKEWRKDMQNHCINRHLKSNCLQNLDNYLMELCQDWTNKIKF